MSDDRPVPTNQFGTPLVPGPAGPSSPTWPDIVPDGPAPTARPNWTLWSGVALLVVITLVVGVIGLRSRFGGTAHRPSAASTIDDGGSSAASGLPAALIDHRPSASSVVTADSALAVIQALWPLRNQAMTTSDLPLLARLETGSALTGDVERSFCGCVAQPDPDADPGFDVSAPPQATYPATFEAQVVVGALNGEPFLRQIMVLRRVSSSTPWQVVFVATGGYDEVPLLAPPPERDHMQVGVPSSKAALIRRLAATLAQEWQEAKVTGRVPKSVAPFTRDAFTDAKIRQLAAHPSGTLQSNGVVERFTYSTDRADPVYLAYEGDTLLGCTVIHRRVVATPPRGRVLSQGAARLAWGPALGPGKYTRIVQQGVAQTCFEVTTLPNPPSIVVVGGAEDAESVVTSAR